MSKMVKVWCLVGFLIVALILTGGCGGQKQGENSNSNNTPKSNEVVLSTYRMGGFWHVLGGGIIDAANKEQTGVQITLVEGAGSIANIMGCNTGQYQLGFAWAPALKPAFEGAEPYSGKMDNIRILGAFYDGSVQFAVDKDSKIKNFGDLKGKKLAPTTKGSETEALMQTILSLYGLTYDDLAGVDFGGLSDVVGMMKDGHLDCVGATLPVPASALTEADAGMGIKLVALDADKFEKLREINPAYGKKTIPAGTYSGQKEDIDVISYPVVLIANKDVSDDVVYKTLKSCFDQKEVLATLSKDMVPFNPEYAYRPDFGPLHPGAEKLYKELGVIK